MPDELKLLTRHYELKGAALIPIYGRRRVGKSRLIEEFIRGKPHIYFLGKRTNAELQLADFRDAAQRLINNAALVRARFGNWREGLETVTALWGGEKLVLVLDELQWSAETAPELPSILQLLWDTQWKTRTDLMVILCGSQLGFMEREILGQKSPLFGRRSDQIRLGPLSLPRSGTNAPPLRGDRSGRHLFPGRRNSGLPGAFCGRPVASPRHHGRVLLRVEVSWQG